MWLTHFYKATFVDDFFFIGKTIFETPLSLMVPSTKYQMFSNCIAVVLITYLHSWQNYMGLACFINLNFWMLLNDGKIVNFSNGCVRMFTKKFQKWLCYIVGEAHLMCLSRPLKNYSKFRYRKQAWPWQILTFLRLHF